MTHPKIRLHAMTPFDRSAKARWLLAEMGVTWEDRWIDREKKEYESPEYLRLNPMGRIPVLEVGDAVMFESAAIGLYLADLFAGKGMAPAPDSPDRAHYLQWCLFAVQNFDVIQTRIMTVEDIPAGDVFDKKQSELLADLEAACRTLDRTLSRADYLVGNRFSNADIGVAYHATVCRLWPELDAVISRFPSVTGYLDRLRARPAAVQVKAFSFPG